MAITAELYKRETGSTMGAVTYDDSCTLDEIRDDLREWWDDWDYAIVDGCDAEPVIVERGMTLAEQIGAVRESGAVNMLDANGVAREAMEREFYDLAVFAAERKDDYRRYLMTGDEEILKEV